MTTLEPHPTLPAQATSRDPLHTLWKRSQRGDREALRALLEHVAPEITRVARTIVSSGDLDDVVQESLLGLLRALPSFRGDCSLRRFAHRITVRTAMHNRRRATDRQLRQRTLEQVHLPPDVPSPAHDCAVSRRRQLLAQILAELPEAQAETLALRVVLGFSLEETANATGVPVNTVRSRMRLARAAMRQRIETHSQLLDLLEQEP